MSLSIESNPKDFIINGSTMSIEPEDWLENSTFRLMYEGDKGSKSFSLEHKNINIETVQLIKDVITKNVVIDRVDPDTVDWKNLKFAVDYLGLGISVDYIHPLFLTQKDRIEWFNSCETRQTYICKYDPDAEEKLIELKYSDIKREKSPYDVTGNSDYPSYENFPTSEYEHKKRALTKEIIDELKVVPELFVAGGAALALFLDNCGNDENCSIIHYGDVDIFAYGPNALAHIIEGVKICEKWARKDESCINIMHPHISVRTQYAITINVFDGRDEATVAIQFILLKSRSPNEILSRFDLDCCTIGFFIDEPDRFYGFCRTVNALNTMVNIVDPTRRSPSYVSRLIKYAHRCFGIAIPGLNIDNLTFNPKILGEMMNRKIIEETCREKFPWGAKITGLNHLLLTFLMGRVAYEERESGDYSHVDSTQIFTLAKHKKEKLADIDFVVGDVLNEDSEKFRYKLPDDAEWTYYESLHPKIKLIDNDHQSRMIGSVHQVTESFYGQYYGIEDIEL